MRGWFHGWRSIEHQLAVLTTAILLVLMLGGGWAAYQIVRTTTLHTARHDLDIAADRLAQLVATALDARVASMRELADDPAIRTFVRTGDPAPALAALEAFGDGPQVLLEIRTPAGAPLLGTGRFPVEWSPRQEAAAREVAGSTDGLSELFAVNGRAYFWVTAPIEAGGGGDAVLAQLRTITGGAASTIGDIVGPDYSLYYVNRSGAPWVTIDGRVVAPPFAVPDAPPAIHRRPGDGKDALAETAFAGQSPLGVIAEAPLDQVLAGTRSMLRLLLGGGLVLLLIGAVSVRLLARRITRPILDLADAAQAFEERGEARPVPVDRRDEIGRLAAVFNGLQQAVGATQRELRQRIQESEAARMDAEAADRAKSEFLATISHEVRTPLNAIIGYTDLLLLGVPRPVTEEQRPHLDRIRASARQMLALVDEVLDLSRIEAGRLAVDAATGQAGEAIRTAIDAVAPSAAQRGIEIRQDEGEDDPVFSGDLQRVRQILINLLTNAVKFSPDGSTVRVAVERASDEVVFAVRDEGVGIAPDQLERIFEPFVQADQSYTRSHGGAGLGLTISRRLARLMGGEITVDSTPGRGSTFALVLPAARPQVVA